MTTETTETKTRTITLTDRPPVRIREEQWPVIAHGLHRAHDGQVECQANRTWKTDIRVRQHEDGRSIVYGTYDYDSAWQGERGVDARDGVLLDAGEDLVAAIRSVGASMAEAGGDDHRIAEAVRQCIADLPAEEL